MKLYAKTVLQTLPAWATTVRQSGDLFEIEINDEYPDFQSLLEELKTEIEPGTIGVKAKDLCLRLSFDLSNPNLHPLIERSPNSDIQNCCISILQTTAGRGIST